MIWLLLATALAQTPPAPPDGEPAVEELPIVEAPAVLRYVEAPYPADAEAAQIEGTVLLLVEIDETGAVTHVEVLTAAGHGFDEAALQAVQQMSFSPARTAEGPVPVAIEFAYGFTLKAADPVEVPEADLPPPPINLDGTVVEMGTRRPIEGARVAVDGTDLVATTDAEGRFALRGVPLGTQVVRVLNLGHVTLTANVDITEGEVSTWKFWLRGESYRENEAIGVYQREKEEVTRRTITIEEIRRVPGTFGDPIKVVQTLPGAARTPFGTGLLVIRGSDPEDSAVYVDGVRIPIIYHLTGTTSVLSPDLIESVDYLPGGYGTQYGRSMGGVVDVRTKKVFEDGKLVWGTDILDSQVYYEGNLGKNKQHGFSIAARRSYIDALLPLFLTGDFVVKPRYWDYQTKWVPRLTEGREFSVFVYGFDDIIRVSTPQDVAQGTDQDTQGDLFTHYGTHRLLVRYAQPIGERWTFELTPSLGYDLGSFGLGNEFRLASGTWIAEVRAEARWTPGPALELIPGVDFIASPYWWFDFKSPLSFSDLDDPLAERDPAGFDGNGSAWGPDLYLKANVRPLEDRERWLITPGVRADLLHYTYAGGVTGDGIKPWTRFGLDPRIATRFEVFEGGTLKAATGLYNQPPQPFESIGVGTEVTVDMERALTSSVGFEHQVTPAVHWDLDLFYKKMDHLVTFNDGWTGFGDDSFVNAGSGRAYGMEVMVRHDPVGRFFGWVSYTLSRAIRRDGPDRDWYAFDFDQTHIFSAQGGYDLPHDFGVSVQVQYTTGAPTSVLDTGVYDIDSDAYNGFRIGGYNDDRQPPYFQTSVRFDKLWTFKRWQLETYVDLLNVVRGVNPEFTTYAYDYSEYAYVRGLPFIPNIGIEAKFWP